MLSDSAVGWEDSAASRASCSTVVIVTAVSYLLVLRAFHAEALPTNSSPGGWSRAYRYTSSLSPPDVAHVEDRDLRRGWGPLRTTFFHMGDVELPEARTACPHSAQA